LRQQIQALRLKFSKINDWSRRDFLSVWQLPCILTGQEILAG
jgi:hypothetical protein